MCYIKETCLILQVYKMDERDKTMAPDREHAGGGADVVLTDPGSCVRKTEGRFSVGDLIMNRYKVLAELGRGGMGVVYRCFDEVSNIEVVLKPLSQELAASGWEMDTIKRNFELVQQLNHQYIANYKNLEQDPVSGGYLLIMEYVDGEELRYFLRRKQDEGSFNEELVIKLTHQIAEALDYAHKRKIIHRAIKPANIMVDRNGDIKLLDFGLAAQIHSSLSKVTKDNHEDTSGTVPYMSPEQWICRPQTAASDQYSLAATLYEVFSGNPPFDSADKDNVRHCALNVVPEMLTGVSPAIARAIARALSKNPKDRFACCSDFAAALGGNKIKSAKVPKKGSFSKWAAALIMILLLGAGGAGFTSSEKEVPVPAPVSVSVPKPKKLTVALENQELAKIDCNGVSLEMVKIKAGTFTMGSPEGELGRSRDETQHQVTLTKDYWLGKFEVTQAQYEAIMGNNPSSYKGSNRPVEEVSWKDAKEFCNKLNERYAGKLPAGYKFDLPTEAQWEYACRAGTTTALNNGKNLTSEDSVCQNLDEVAWYRGNSRRKTHPVGEKKPNAWGLYDMHGNVWEWCRDWDASYIGDVTDPTGPSGSHSHRVLRGGSWDSRAVGCRSANRGGSDPRDRVNHIGFRLALSEKEVPAPVSVSVPKPKKLTVALENQELAKIDCNGVSLEMVKIKTGTFTMGSPGGELGRFGDEKQHQVTLTKDYWLGKFELTQAQYEAIMGKNPSLYKGSNRPVENVSWEDAKEFCNKLNEHYAGKLPAGYKFDLPTEAQWEYACRAGTTTALNNGTNLTSKTGKCSNLNEVGWYDKNSGSDGHKAVGQKRPNNWGLYDMHGNVCEWCRDRYAFYTGDATDPTGHTSSSVRVFRGGGWSIYARSCRSAERVYYSPRVRRSFLGFRIALVPVQ